VPYDHILTVYDGSPESKDLLDMVCRIARPQRTRLTILILRTVPLTQELPTYRPGSDPSVDGLVREAVEFAQAHHVNAAPTVRYARSLAASVIDESRLLGVDLVALQIPDLERLPSDQASHTEVRAVLRQTACAVMLWRHARTPIAPE
jgi:nucleotide-binding universal stress UspA family protein